MREGGDLLGRSPEGNFSAIDWLAVDDERSDLQSRGRHSAFSSSRGTPVHQALRQTPQHLNDDDDEVELSTPTPAAAAHQRHRRQHQSGTPRHHADLVMLCIGTLSYCAEAAQPWVAAILVGVIGGVVASSVEVVTQWLTDLKLGYCQFHIWATEHLCCVHDASAWLRQCAGFVYWGEWAASDKAATVLGSSSQLLIQFSVYVVVSTLLAGLACWLCIQYAPYASGSGIIEIKTLLSGIRIKNYLSVRVLCIKCVGLCASVGSGLALGKEGPFVHVGSCIGHMVGQWFPLYRNNEGASRQLISASAAAGVAVAFGAPIGGVLFSLEEVSYFFPHRTMIQAFLTAIVSTLLLKKMDPTDTGRLVLFSVTYHHEFHWFELAAFALLGVVGGVVGALINSLNAAWVHIKLHSRIKQHPVVEVVVLAALSSVLNFMLPLLRGGMLQTLADLFDDCNSTTAGDESFLCFQDETWALVELTLAALIRCVLMALTFGCKLPAGCFVPSLFIGACCGRAVGIWSSALVKMNFATSEILQTSCGTNPNKCVVPGVYAIVGAAAVLAGVTRMTICLVVIMFELTGGLEYVVPCMLVTVTAKWVAELIGIPSIYEIHLDISKYPYLNTKDEYPFRVTLRSLMAEHRRGDHEPCRAPSNDSVGGSRKEARQGGGWPTTQNLLVLWNGMSLAEVFAAVNAPRVHHYYPVVHGKDSSHFLGCVKHSSLRAELGKHAYVWETTLSSDAAHHTIVFFHRGEATLHLGEHREDDAPSAVDWSHTLDSCTVQVSLEMTLPKLIHIFKTLGNHQVYIVEGGKLVGVMTRKDMVRFLRKARADGTARGSLMRWISDR